MYCFGFYCAFSVFNIEKEVIMDPYQNRRWVIIMIILLTGVVFIFRLFFLQVVNDKWKNRAHDISYSEKNIYPPRGLIYDRNGKLLVSANQVYDIMITPKEIGKNDTLKICKTFELTNLKNYENIY